jgi:hypothetical protein
MCLCMKNIGKTMKFKWVRIKLLLKGQSAFVRNAPIQKYGNGFLNFFHAKEL